MVDETNGEKEVDSNRKIFAEHYFGKKNKFSNLLRILNIIAIWLFLAVMIFLLIFLVKYKDMLRVDVLSYGMELHNFTSCECYDSNGKLWYSINNSGGFKHTERGENNFYYNPDNLDDMLENLK
jgi:hypothetical protein